MRAVVQWACILSLAGCASSASPAPVPAPASNSSEAAPETVVAEREGVVVVEAGAEPRERLALALTPGSVSYMLLEMYMSRTDTLDGVARPTTESNVRLEMSRTVGAFDGEWYDIHYDVMAVYQNDVEIQAAIDGFDVRVSVDGEVHQSGGAVSLGVADQLSMRLPRAPVGVGARWTDELEVNAQIMTVRAVRMNELTAFDGRIATIQMGHELDVPPQQMVMDSLGPGYSAWITSMSLTGTTSIEIDIQSPPPHRLMASGRVVATGEVREGPKVELTFKVEMETSVSMQPFVPGP